MSIKEIAVPTFSRGLSALTDMLDRAGQYSAAQGSDPDLWVAARLAEDMHPLLWQVRKTAETSSHALCLLGDQPVPKDEFNIVTFTDLQKRLASSLLFVRDVPAGSLTSADERLIELDAGPREVDAMTFLMAYALPNFYFHLAAAYNILRSKGVPINKLNFLGVV